MEEKFSIPMSRTILAVYFLTMGMIAAAVAWSFKAGFLWTAICLIAVAAPLGLFYWYMLYVNTQRASISLDDQGVHIVAPPFLEAMYPYAAITRAFMTELKQDERLKQKEDKRIMRFGAYKSGTYALVNGGEAIILTNRNNVLCLVTSGKYIILGPDGMQRLQESLRKQGINISSTS